MVYADTLSSYNNNRIDIASKLHEIIHRREADLFEYAFENFADLCRFCFKLRADNDAGTMEEIFEDSSDESLDLILKINFTLYGNVRLHLFS